MYVDHKIEDFHSFFDQDDNQANSPPKDNLFHQTNPMRRCRLTWGRGCRNHKCSTSCRKRWASKESLILRRHLHALPEGTHVYFGELSILGDPTAAEHKKARTKFQTALTKLGKERQGSVKLLAVSEVGNNGRLHNHFCLVSSFEVRQQVSKKLWSEAASGSRTIVSHGRPRSIDARVKYQFKDLKEPGNVRLLRKGAHASLGGTWTSTPKEKPPFGGSL